MLTGNVHTREIDVTEEQIADWEQGMLIQDAMPNLSDGHREFLISGATQEEWEDAYPPEDLQDGETHDF